MENTWRSFEGKVRSVASHIWNGNCSPQNIGGVDLDGVLLLGPDAQIFIEITEERKLNKVREDINKLLTARNAYLQEFQSFPRCYCVIDGTVTSGMLDAAKPHKINVLSYDDFSKIFFDFDKYRFARETVAFGSALNPLTGAKDDREYIDVTYIVDESGKEIGASEIVKMLRDGKHVILMGEYGTGKSRCFRQLFKELSASVNQNNLYQIAIDLRDSCGLKKSRELITRHFDNLGLDENLSKAAIRCFNAGRAIFLLDGFDELGSQSWSNDNDKLKTIRAKSLEGVKDLITKEASGVIVSGREHYFNSNEEMLSALGMDKSRTVIVRCKDEFSEAEIAEYFENNDLDVVLPKWLPRRPLICQTIADMSDDDLDQIFRFGDEELRFWDYFVDIVCRRDATIHASFDSNTIKRILVFLARVTRARAANVGPITLSDVQAAFESVVGQLPVEEASLMLQRLPALGRLKAESNDRQFIDTYILDGLRANDVGALITSSSADIAGPLSTTYLNPLEELGLRLLAREVVEHVKQAVQLVRKSADAKNRVIGCDIISAFMYGDLPDINFEGIRMSDGRFGKFEMSRVTVSSLTIEDSYFASLVLPSSVPPKGLCLCFR